jgi:Lanthionine synthetase C-like protein.
MVFIFTAVKTTNFIIFVNNTLMMMSGAAHGLSGILQMLLSFPAYLQSDPVAEQDVKSSVDYLLSLQSPSGNFPCAMDELGSRARPEADELVHWCHGAAGSLVICGMVIFLDVGFGAFAFDPM